MQIFGLEGFNPVWLSLRTCDDIWFCWFLLFLHSYINERQIIWVQLLSSFCGWFFNGADFPPPAISPGNITQCLETFFVFRNGVVGMPQASSGLRSGRPLNNLQCTGRPSSHRQLPAPKVQKCRSWEILFPVWLERKRWNRSSLWPSSNLRRSSVLPQKVCPQP